MTAAAPPLSPRGVYGSLHLPGLRDLIYSTKAFVAAAVALAIGFSQNLDNPYWSALTVYVVVNPPGAGAIRSKALFRLAGTVMGGLLVLALTGIFVDQTGILVTATVAAIVGAIFLQHIDKTPTNYMWMALGVTISVIELNNITRPANIFDITTARVGEISLGLLVVAAVDTFWPEPITPAFLKTMGDWRGKARDWLADALGPKSAAADDVEYQNAARDRLQDLIKGLAAIDGKAVQLPFDVVPTAPRKADLNLLRRQVVAAIGDLAAIELRIGALRRSGGRSADLQHRLDGVVQWVCDGPASPGANVDAHVARGEALAEELDEAAFVGSHADGSRHALIERSLLSRTARFVRDWCDMSLALRAIETGRALPPRLQRVARNAKPVRSVDYLGAALDMIPMVLAMGTAVAIWYLTAWDTGPTALLFAWAGCLFLIGQGQIPQSMLGMLCCVLIAFTLVYVYQFVILPRVTDFPILVIVLACGMIPFGLLMAMSLAGMLILALALSFLALQSAYNADFAQTTQTLSGCLVGILISLCALRLCEYDRARFAVRRLANAVRRDVLDVARASRLPDPDRYLFLAMYRVSLYLTASQQAAQTGPTPRLGLIPDLIIGANLLEMRRREAEFPPATRDVIERLRGATADVFKDELAGHPDDRPLRAAVDAAMADPAIHDDAVPGGLRDAVIGLDLALAVPELPAVKEEQQ